MNFIGRQSSSPASIEYHGLAKKGATCYLNSVLQVLFMTEDFREAVIRHSKENSQFIDQDLKALFEDLQNHTAETDGIIQKLGIDDVYELHDPAEYFEKLLTLTSPQASQIFRGALAKKTTCCKCLTKTDRDIPFWHLPLALVDSGTDTPGSEVYRVVDGIEEFFRPAELNGENQTHCDRCGHKVDATTTAVIKHHPDVLLLLPKRSEFSYHHISHVKISCSVEVPYILKIPENQTYELYAVVDHFGDMRSGYYSARIQHEDRWYKFDDTRVTPLDYQLFQVDDTEKSESAYLLFYRKKKNAATEEIEEMHTSGRFLNEWIEEEVKGDASVHNVIYSALKEVRVETQTRGVRDDGEEKKGADKYIQRSKITMGKPDHSEAVRLESMRLDDVGQKTTEKIISVSHTSQSEAIQSKQQQNEDDRKQNQSEGSFQPKTRTGIQGVTEGGRRSKKSSPRVKVTDEEHTEIPSAFKQSSKSKTIIRKTLDETVQDTTKWLESQRNIRRSLNL